MGKGEKVIETKTKKKKKYLYPKPEPPFDMLISHFSTRCNRQVEKLTVARGDRERLTIGAETLAVLLECGQIIEVTQTGVKAQLGLLTRHE